MNTFWGDLHNHCAISYGKGTPQLALDNARRHLDFCSITGHAFWPDMPKDMDLNTPFDFEGIHLGGFAKLKRYWPSLLEDLKAADRPGSFVTLPSYEWHSIACGDYNCYAPEFDLKLMDAPDVCTLAERLRHAIREFILLPHHCGYVQGHRGTNWELFDESVSPIVEIYSNHGCCESEDAPFSYYHSMGPRTEESMLRARLAAGRRFGFYASTDSHDGYPGHYGHGRVGVQADRLERYALWEALKSRRTIASTGVNLGLQFSAGDVGMGSVCSSREPHDLRINIEGEAPLESIELIEGGANRWRVRQLETNEIASDFTPGRFKIKLEAGWGHGNQPSLWNTKVRVVHGDLDTVTGYFRFSNWDPARTVSSESIKRNSKCALEWRFRSLPNPAAAMGGTHFNAGGTQSIVLDLNADRRTRLSITVGELEFDVSIRDLVAGSIARHIAGQVTTAFKIHRAIPEREFSKNILVPKYMPFSPDHSFVYLRIRQTDGQTAWASPIWFE